MGQPNEKQQVLAEVLAELRRSDGAATLRQRVVAVAAPPPTGSPAPDETLARDGYATLRALAGPDLTAPLRDTVHALVSAGLPGVLAFMRDEMWVLGELVRRRVEALVGASYAVLDDAWAWSIAPGRGRGWPPHRGGVGARVFDRQAPELVTVWVALGDVAAEQACMHVVPLDEDPNYPNALEQLSAPLHAVRALPIAAGDALAWNANLLHWGGSSARARAPRVSTSFSLGRVDAAPPLGLAAIDAEHTTLDDRLAYISGWLATYGVGQPDVAPEFLQWSRIHRQLAAARKER